MVRNQGIKEKRGDEVNCFERLIQFTYIENCIKPQIKAI